MIREPDPAVRDVDGAATPPAIPAVPWLGEARLVREAILLVELRGAPRVLVAGIRWGEAVLEELRRPALERGVRLLARSTAQPDRVDIVVEPVR